MIRSPLTPFGRNLKGAQSIGMHTIRESIVVIFTCEELPKRNDTAQWSPSEDQYKS